MESNMRDQELTLWTTYPNVFFIATHTENENKVLGIIGCKKISNTTTELARLVVVPDARYL